MMREDAVHASTSSDPDFDHVQQYLIDAAGQVKIRIEAEYEQLLRTDPERAADFRRRLTPEWKDKYLDRASDHIVKWAELLPHLDGVPARLRNRRGARFAVPAADRPEVRDHARLRHRS